MLDIIIPVYNEEKILKEKKDYYKALGRKARLIFVDGGSTDKTADVAGEYGDIIHSKKGRGVQKNAGAKHALTNKLLFLHADTFIDDITMRSISRSLDNGIAGGCLTMLIEGQGRMFRFYERVVNFRASKFGVIDGDLGTFVKKDIFEKTGGFDEVSVMEDLLFGRKLRNAGRIKMLPEIIRVSPRKWYEKGFVKTFFSYTLAYIQLWTKFPFFK